MDKEPLLYDVVHDYIISENFASDTEGANKVMLKLSDELMQKIYERTMTASEKRKDTMLKKKYDDSDMKKNMQAQYGKEEGKKVYFATIRKQAMKKEEVEQEDPSVKAKEKRQAMIKKQVLMKKLQAVRAGAGADITSSHEPEGNMVEAKVDKGKSDAAKQNERNQRTFGNRRGSRGSLASHEDTEARRYNTEKGRGVKMKGKKDKTPVNYHKKDSQKRVDALLKSMKEGVKRDEYGDIVGGPKISKKQKAKNLSKNEPDNKIVRSEAAAWTRKAGKNKEGGLNEKGRKSYERENPGSDLKAPSKKVGNPRRKSFCARMRGMKKKLTSAKTARDPDSRINKSLRAWNCSYEWPKDKEMIETTSLKNEIIAKAQEKHKEAKQKKYKQIMDAGKAAKKKVGKDPRGVRALSKGKWGYVKNNTFTPD